MSNYFFFYYTNTNEVFNFTSLRLSREGTKCCFHARVLSTPIVTVTDVALLHPLSSTATVHPGKIKLQPVTVRTD